MANHTKTPNEVMQRTAITARQLQWWDERGVVKPEREGRRRIYSRQALAGYARALEGRFGARSEQSDAPLPGRLKQLGAGLLMRSRWFTREIVTRRWFLWKDRVRIHLDRVEGLGEFLEFEAAIGAAPGYDEDAARLDVARLSHDFGVTSRDLVAGSYATLVKSADTTPAGT